MTQSATLTSAPRPPGVVRRWLAAHPKFVDRGIAVCYLIGSAFMSVLGWVDRFVLPSPLAAAETAPVGWIIAHEVVTTAIIFVVLWRRRTKPLIGFTITALMLMLSWPASSYQPVADGTALLFMMYAVPVYGTVLRGWIAFGIAAVTELLSATGWVSLTFSVTEEWRGVWSVAVVTHLIALLIGINVGNRRRYVDALVDRAEMLERDREQLARIAVGKERERIAREMHDIVAHSLSVMIALGEGAARTVTTAPDKASNAMQRSAETGRSALAEMRRLLGVLSEPEHDGEVELAPMPGSTDLAAVIDDVRSAGVDVTLTTTGAPTGDPGMELAVYRIVQESLTNTLRYAGPGARAEVTLTCGPDTTDITVRDHGPSGVHAPSLTTLGGGNGLTGLTERVRMFGGTIDYGPHPGGGWQVRASLPQKGTP